MKNISCNCDGYCQYKLFGGSIVGCSYQGYCDYQAPRDSRGLGVQCFPPVFKSGNNLHEGSHENEF